MSRIVAFGLIILALPALAGAFDEARELTPTQEKLIELGQNDNQVMDTLHHLVNVIGPRLTGSYQDHKACEWAVAQFEEYGLSNVTIEEAGEFPMAFHRGPWSGKMLEPEEMTLEFGTSAWSAGTRGVVTGPAMLPPENVEDTDPADYVGAWIFNSAQRGRRDRGDRTQIRAQREFLENAGVAGMIFPTRNEYITTGGNSRVEWDDLPQTPRINMLKDHYDAIRDRLENDEKVVLQFDIRNHFEKGPTKYYNVWGDITGSEFPDQVVVIGGHIDSWDGASGTTDNGTGAATTMESARLLAAAGAKPRRTIRFMLWSGEEQGLLGSRAYVEKNPELHEKISACFVYDGGPNAVAAIPMVPSMKDDFEQAFAAVIGLNEDLPFRLEAMDSIPRGIGSDHESFLRAGIPGFFWTQEGRANWRHGIHTQFDTYDLAIPEYLEHSALVIALAALGVADLDGLLARDGIEKGDRRRGFAGGGRRMGVMLDGTTVERVVEGSVAEKAGLEVGDVIISIAGEAVDSRRALMRAIRGEGTKKKVVVKRGEKEVELVFEWPAPEEEKKEEKKAEVVL